MRVFSALRFRRRFTSADLCTMLVVLALTHIAQAATQSATLVINGQNGVLISGLTISTTTGDCIDVINSSHITIQNSQIGPCGTENSTSNSRGIYISGSSGISVYDNYIHVENLASGCCDTHDNILVAASNYITVEGNVIAYGETNVEVTSAAPSSNISIVGNFLLNPRGPYPRGQNIQVYGADPSHLHNNLIVQHNFTLSTASTTYLYPANQEDSLSFGYSGPSITVSGNYLLGGTSNSGCGVTFDYGVAGGSITNNKAAQYNCGVQVTAGTGVLIDSNKVFVARSGPHGAAIITATFNLNTGGCSKVTLTNNVAYSVSNGSWYNDRGCGTVSNSGNTLGTAAYNALYPFATTNPPPLIPPQPHACVAMSPYSTQTSYPACASGSSTGTGSPPPIRR